MFKLLVSKTLLSLSMALVLSGPGMAVWMMGALGSSGKKACSPPSATAVAAAAEAYRRRKAIGATLEAARAVVGGRAARARPAVRRREAMAGDDVREGVGAQMRGWALHNCSFGCPLGTKTTTTA